MLKIFNDLKPFFEDNYIRIGVREFARKQNISPPSASTHLKKYHQEGLLKQEKDKQYIYYFANKENNIFRKLCGIYWEMQLKELCNYLEEETMQPLIILFGSLTKGEVHNESDIDIAVFTPTKKKPAIEQFEKKLKREIHLLMFSSKSKVANKYLLNNILNGTILRGTW